MKQEAGKESVSNSDDLGVKVFGCLSIFDLLYLFAQA